MERSASPLLFAVSLGCAALIAAACSSATGTNDTSSTTSQGGGDGGVEVDLDGGGSPAIHPDGAAACPAGACNYQTGSGCVTGSCLPTLTGDTPSPTCVMAGTVAADGACTKTTDCVAGHVCASGSCRKLCCGGDWTGCDSAAEHCLQGLSYTGTSGDVATGAMVCYPVNTCDALTPATCSPAGTACLVADATGATACLPEGTGEAGEACPCKGGFVCTLQTGKAPACVRLCKAVPGGGSPYCGSNEGICTHYTRDPEGVGECQAPGSN